MAKHQTTNVNRYKVEIDGFPIIYATQATIPQDKMTPHTHQPGNEKRPHHGIGNYEVEEMTFRHASGNGNVDRLLYRWFKDVENGLDGKRNARVVQFDAAGRTPIRTYEFTGCLPTGFKLEDLSGDGNDRSDFTISLQPDNMRLL